MLKIDSLIDEALAKAVAYRTFSLAFQLPTDARLREMGAFDGFGSLAEAFGCLDCGADGQRLQASVRRLTSMRIRDVEALETQYWRLFGHTTRGLICACETEYGDENNFQQPQQLADISGFYLAFGLTPPAAMEVRPDHVASECEFMDFLSRKEAWLLATAEPADADTLTVTREAGRAFLRDHLGYFGRAFAGKLVAQDPEGYFGALGECFLRFLDVSCAMAGVTAGPADLSVRRDLVDDSPMACGSADELIQIQRRP
jgi:TorA maturation chaperone TorD